MTPSLLIEYTPEQLAQFNADPIIKQRCRQNAIHYVELAMLGKQDKELKAIIAEEIARNHRRIFTRRIFLLKRSKA